MICEIFENLFKSLSSDGQDDRWNKMTDDIETTVGKFVEWYVFDGGRDHWSEQYEMLDGISIDGKQLEYEDTPSAMETFVSLANETIKIHSNAHGGLFELTFELDGKKYMMDATAPAMFEDEGF